MVQIIYRWPDGREEVRYERPEGTKEALELISEVEQLQEEAKKGGYESPYTFRIKEVA